jgi:hypothetical protein
VSNRYFDFSELRQEELHEGGQCGGLAEGCTFCEDEAAISGAVYTDDGVDFDENDEAVFDTAGFFKADTENSSVRVLTAEEIDALYPSREYRVNARI